MPAQQLAAKIVDQGLDLVVPGIERVQGPDQSELRFFKKADQNEATRIAVAFQGLRLSRSSDWQIMSDSRQHG